MAGSFVVSIKTKEKLSISKLQCKTFKNIICSVLEIAWLLFLISIAMSHDCVNNFLYIQWSGK